MESQIGNVINSPAIVIDKKSFTVSNVTQDSNYTLTIGGTQIGNIVNSRAIVIDQKSFTVSNVTQGTNYTVLVNGIQIGNVVNSPTIVIDQKSFTVSNVTQDSNYILTIDGIQIGNIVNSRAIVIDKKLFTVSNVTENSNYTLTVDGVQIGTVVNSPATVIDQKSFTVSNVTANSNYTLTVNGSQVGNLVNSRAIVIDKKSFTVSNVTSDSNYTLTVDGIQIGNIVNARTIFIDKKLFTINNVSLNSGYFLTVDGIQVGNIVSSYEYFSSSTLYGVTISGQLSDALNPSIKLSNATINILDTNNSIKGSTTTNSNGNYTINVPIGKHILHIIMNGYIGIKDLIDTTESTTYNFSMTQNINTGDIRLVLTWGAAPADLDSHIKTKIQGGITVTQIDSFYIVGEHNNSNQTTLLDYDATNESLSIINGPILVEPNDWIGIFSNTDLTLGTQYQQSSNDVNNPLGYVWLTNVSSSNTINIGNDGNGNPIYMLDDSNWNNFKSIINTPGNYNIYYFIGKRSTVYSLNQPINRMDIVNIASSDFHIYYGNTNAGNITLDVDDTNGYGPETMTISNASTGTSYAYYVYNYDSPTLVNCGAVATIYDSDGNKVVVNINDASGTTTSHKYWHICNFNSSKNIEIINQIQSSAPSVPSSGNYQTISSVSSSQESSFYQATLASYILSQKQLAVLLETEYLKHSSVNISDDTNWTNTKFLLKSDTTSGSTSFVDSSDDNNTISTPTYSNLSNDVQHNSTIKKFGSTAIKFDGSGDYLRCDSALDWHTNVTQDFTIECWAYQASDVGWQCAIGINSITYGTDNLLLIGSGDNLSFNGSDLYYTSNRVGEWVHYAVVQDNSNIRFYVNGAMKYSQSGITVDTPLADCSLLIGTEADSSNAGVLGNWWNGYIEDVRISSNVRYKGTSSTEWDNYLYDGVSRWDTPIISHPTGISRVLIGVNEGVAISGNLSFINETNITNYISSNQVFYENFEDNSYSGNITTADIVSGGYDGSSYSLKSGTNTIKTWKQTTSDSLPSNVRAISFWHKTTSTTVGTGADNGNHQYILDYRNDSNNSGLISVLWWLYGTNNYQINSYNGDSKFFKRWFVNGELMMSDGGSATSSNVNISNFEWVHHYIELDSSKNSPGVLQWFQPIGLEDNKYSHDGYLDEIRFFDSALTNDEIQSITYMRKSTDITFNNSLQIGVEKYTNTELASLLETEYLKHSSINSASGSAAVRTLSGVNTGVHISGDLAFSGGTSGDITFNNSIQTGIQKYTTTELASLLETEYLKHSSINSASGSSTIRTLSGVNTGVHISGDLAFTGGTSGDITFNNSLQIGVQAHSVAELATLLETEYLKHSSINISDDTNWTNTKFLLKSDTTSGSTSFVDSSDDNNTISSPNFDNLTNNVEHNSTIKKFGATAIKFDGNGDYLRCDTALDWHTNVTQDFTIECWAYQVSDAGAWNCAIGINSISYGTDNLLLIGAGDNLSFNGSDVYYTSNRVGEWVHYAVVQDNSNIRFYVNGAMKYSQSGTIDTPLADCCLLIGTEADTSNAGQLGNWWNGYIEDVRISSNVRYKGTSSNEWDNYLYDGVSRWDIPIISHVTEISRVLIGVNSGVGISGDLAFTGGTVGDITFNNSLQTGVQKYTTTELASLLQTEYLKHSSIISASGSAAIRTFSGVSTGVHISGDLAFTGGTSGDITFNNLLQIGVQAHNVTELASLLQTEYLKHSSIDSASGSVAIRTLSGTNTGVHISGDLTFTGGTTGDITFNNSVQIGVQKYTLIELAILLETEYLKHSSIISVSGSSTIRTFSGVSTGVHISGDLGFIGGTSGDLTFNNSLQIGVQKYTITELATLLETEYLKHSLINSASGSSDIRILSGLDTGARMSGNPQLIGENCLGFTGGSSNDITFNNSLQIGEGLNYISIKTIDVLNTSYTLTLPSEAPTDDKILKSDSNGNLTWVSVLDAQINDLNDAVFYDTATGDFAGTLIIGSTNVGNDGAYAKYNSGFGKDVLDSLTTGARNLAMGYLSLSKITASNDNTSIGAYSMENTSGVGTANCSIGSYSLNSNTSGSYNISNGYKCMFKNTTGGYNISVGVETLYNNTSGYYNTAIGYKSLFTNSGGSYNSTASNSNVAIGYKSLYSNFSGGSNTSIGTNSMFRTTTGSNNIGIGESSGYNNTAGFNNVFIGYNSDTNSGTISNSVSLGNASLVSASNTIQLGNSNISSLKCQVSLTVSSDRRIKKNIQIEQLGLKFITSLNPVCYNKINPCKYPKEIRDPRYDNKLLKESEDDDNNYIGLIAQEVEESLQKCNRNIDDIVDKDNLNGQYSIKYTNLIMPLINAVKELNNKIDRLERQNKHQQSIIENLKNKIEK